MTDNQNRPENGENGIVHEQPHDTHVQDADIVEDTHSAAEYEPAPESTGGKVLGIPKAKYAKLCYVLILISAGFSVLTALLMLFGGALPFGGIFSLLGLIGVALMATGWLAFGEEFSALEISHFKFMSVLFVALIVFNIIFFNALLAFGAFGALLMFVITLIEFLIVFAAFRTYEKAMVANIHNVKETLIGFKNYLNRN